MLVTVTVRTNKQQETPVEIHLIDLKTGEDVAAEQRMSDRTFWFKVDSPRLWTPDSPTLYNITVKMGDDFVTSYTAFRTISAGRVNGVLRPLLNGRFVFWFGPLDQGYDLTPSSDLSYHQIEPLP
jgi:beta-galactosidase/beta-glucuronidase